MKPNPEKSRFRAQKLAFGSTKVGLGRVRDYRLYGLDGVNKVASGEWFEAENDETAIEVAKKMMDGHDCELWRGKRFVARIPSQHHR